MKIGLRCRYRFQNKDASSVVRRDKLFGLVNNVSEQAFLGGTAPQSGDGSYDAPYVPSRVTDWAFLAKRTLDQAPTFISVGGRLIAQWGTSAENFQRYCTDVTDLDKDNVVQGREQTVRDIGQHFQKRDAQNKVDPKLPAYTKKALRLHHIADGYLAQMSRFALNGGGDCSGCPELASSLSSLFVAEGGRQPLTLMSSLMLLDLIQTGTTYGIAGGKTYTWASMLMHGVDGIHGRGHGIKSLGKHPMAGEGTAGGNKPETQNRIVSIAAVWLAHYLQKSYGHKGYNYVIVRDGPGSMQFAEGTKETKEDGSLARACRDALRQRISGTGILIGGTTVTYENPAGEPV